MWTLSFFERVLFRISTSWKFFIAILLPVVLLPLIFIKEDQMGQDDEEDPERMSTKFRTLYVIVLMAVFWALEIIPLPVTALIPVILFPSLGVQTSYAVSQNYAKESTMIFIGGVVIALAVECCGLHNRIALKVMNIFGSSPVQLLLGTMSIVALLSMWISASSCVAILVPVVCAIIDEIHESPEILSNEEVRRMSIVCDDPQGRRSPQNIRRSSSITGTGTTKTFSGIDSRKNTTVFGNLGLSSSNNFLNGPLDNNFDPSNIPNRGGVYLRHKRDSQLSSLTERGGNQVTFSDRISNASGSVNNISIIIQDVDEQEDNATRIENEEDFLRKEKEKDSKRNEIKKMILFGMAYSANLGGTAVITGTSPNKIFKEVIKTVNLKDGGSREMTFFVWMALNVPPMLINVLIAWLYLSITYYGLPNRTNWPFLRKFCCLKKSLDTDSEEDIYHWRTREVGQFLSREYQKLGRISIHEISVMIIFLLVVLLWIFREPEIAEGWGDQTSTQKTGDSTSAILGVVLFFIVPKNWSFLFGRDKEKCKYEALLDWKFVTTKMPWGVVLLLGSGFAIADASLYSGLSAWIGRELELLEDVPHFVLLIIIVVLTSILTEVVSNIACANILLPVIVSVSTSLKIHPLYLTVPVALTCQYAFLFPIATQSNTLVFAAGSFTTIEMVKTGLFLNCICIAVLIINTVTYGSWWFNGYSYNYDLKNVTLYNKY